MVIDTERDILCPDGVVRATHGQNYMSERHRVYSPSVCVGYCSAPIEHIKNPCDSGTR